MPDRDAGKPCLAELGGTLMAGAAGRLIAG